MRWLIRELLHRWRWRREPSVRHVISPHPAPPGAVERLRRRVESGDWDSP